MISFTETELGDTELPQDDDDLLEEEIHEPSLSLRAQRLLAATSCRGWKAGYSCWTRVLEAAKRRFEWQEAVIPRNPQIVKPPGGLGRCCFACAEEIRPSPVHGQETPSSSWRGSSTGPLHVDKGLSGARIAVDSVEKVDICPKTTGIHWNHGISPRLPTSRRSWTARKS